MGGCSSSKAAIYIWQKIKNRALLGNLCPGFFLGLPIIFGKGGESVDSDMLDQKRPSPAMVGLLQGLEAAHEKKKGRVIFDVLHTKLTLVGAQMAQIGGKWAKTVIF